MINLGVLVSGSGTNLQAIIDAIEAKKLPANINVVISNNPNAYAVQRAKIHNIPVEVIPNSSAATREAYDNIVVEVLKRYTVELVVLAGFMRVLTQSLINAFPMHIMNIHPALLPSFHGLHAQKNAVDYGVKFSGATVHFVDEGIDTGPIIIQAVVPVYDDDTEETLAKRILKEEHKIYPYAIQLFAEGRLEVKGRRVVVKDTAKTENTFLENPSSNQK
ncbi:MAG: phosphoribosylglycinamide formyltransferase [Deltaproteobacteria bacterium GWC2_42_11]|nr:MAG: phosphoribosylglycinamide formyltransferase [Deltaproteobacteria bacterium GWC2_42_11]HBO84050.1 phosphoribosylglycinamide formyltransferase [Deltaproteobacteria bacterium]